MSVPCSNFVPGWIDIWCCCSCSHKMVKSRSNVLSYRLISDIHLGSIIDQLTIAATIPSQVGSTQQKVLNSAFDTINRYNIFHILTHFTLWKCEDQADKLKILSVI